MEKVLSNNFPLFSNVVNQSRDVWLLTFVPFALYWNYMANVATKKHKVQILITNLLLNLKYNGLCVFLTLYGIMLDNGKNEI